MSTASFKLFAGNSNPALAQQISRHLDIPLGNAIVDRFPNGETHVEVLEPVRGKDVFVIQSTSPPVNDHIMELMLLFDALKRASAESVTAVVPYFGYGKQDKRKSGREAISAKVVANMFESAGISRLITLDLHAPQIEAFFNIPVDNLPTISFFARHLQRYSPQNLVIVSTDAGRLKTARKLGQVLGCDIAVIDKYRPSYQGAKAMHLLGEVGGKDAVLIDDFIDTAGSIIAAADAVRANGARSVRICATHALLTPPATERLRALDIDVTTTDTVSIPEERRFQRLEILSVGDMLAEVIGRIHKREPLSPLFEPAAF